MVLLRFDSVCLWLDVQPRRVVPCRSRVSSGGKNGAAGRVTLGVGLGVPSAPVRCGCGDGRARVQILCIVKG